MKVDKTGFPQKKKEAKKEVQNRSDSDLTQQFYL